MSKVLESFQSYFRRTNKLLWLVMIAISVYGLLLVASASRTFATNYFKTQLIAVVLGYIAAYILTRLNYREISNYWYMAAGFCVFLIIYTLIFGEAVVGSSGVNAKAWITLPGGVTFQPSELAKIGFMLTFSKHLSVLNERGLMQNPIYVFSLGAHALIPMMLTHLQGDDGAAVIFFCMFLAMSFAAGVQLRYFAAVFGLFLVAAPLAWKYVLADYQKNRLLIFMNPESDPLGNGLQQIQGKISIGSGGVWGQGLFEGPRVARHNVPIQHSDFIFSVAGEELGFVGASLIIFLLLALLIITLYCARKSSDPLGTYICFGFFGMIASQAIFNIGMCLSLLPVMGVTLPFFSAGGSSTACLYLGFGLVQSVYMYKHDSDKVRLRL